VKGKGDRKGAERVEGEERGGRRWAGRIWKRAGI